MLTPELDQHNLENEISGLLVEYDDDIDTCIKQPIKQKSRVKYNCFHAYGSFLAFGSSSGAIYLFKLEVITHSTCSLITIIPCDQGPVEVVQFSPYSSPEHLLVAMGTSRGSLIVFKLTMLPSEQDLICEEIYRAESFTLNSIELIEHDIDPATTYRIYICDASNNIYVVDNFIEPRIRQLFYAKVPTLLLRIDDSKVNQLSIFRSHLLISTSKSTILFDADTNEFKPVGKKKRKDEGFYGGCFFAPLTNAATNALRMDGDSTLSLVDHVTIYSARPSFRLWQVNLDGSVLFTHQFETAIKSSYVATIVQLKNSPLQKGQFDDPNDIIFNLVQRKQTPPSSDHFQKLIQFHSSTLGQCLLTHTKDELFVLDPNGAKLIVWNTQELTNIRQICCVDNEIYLLCDKPAATAITPIIDANNLNSNDTNLNTTFKNRKNINFHFKRLVLLAPTQYVLELHRLRRYESLIVFVENYIDLFKNKMALPLCGNHVITTEGGLLRNVLLNAWTTYDEDKKDAHEIFELMISSILEEGKQMQQVDDFVSTLSLMSIPSTENIHRIRQEPYASLISLNVSIADLHTSHVIHFSNDTLNRHSSNQLQNSATFKKSSNPGASSCLSGGDKVIVERRRPRKVKSQYKSLNRISLEDRSGSFSCLNINRELLGDLTRIPSQDSLYGPDDIEAAKEPKPTMSLIYGCEKADTHDAQETPGKTILNETPENIDEASTCKEFGLECPEIENHETENDETKSLPEAYKDPVHYVQTIATKELLSGIYCCKECKWPLPNSHNNLHPLQHALDGWIEKNLMCDIETNIAYMEDLAFTNCLWRTYLKCLLYKKNYETYLKCCILLDDIRLMQVESITTYMGSESAIMNVLFMLRKKYETFGHTRCETDDPNCRELCSNCSQNPGSSSRSIIGKEVKYKTGISLVNIAEMAMNCIGPKTTINILLKEDFKGLIDASKIPANFYIQTIKAAVLTAHQSPISRTRLEMLRGSVDENSDEAFPYLMSEC